MIGHAAHSYSTSLKELVLFQIVKLKVRLGVGKGEVECQCGVWEKVLNYKMRFHLKVWCDRMCEKVR